MVAPDGLWKNGLRREKEEGRESVKGRGRRKCRREERGELWVTPYIAVKKISDFVACDIYMYSCYQYVLCANIGLS